MYADISRVATRSLKYRIFYFHGNYIAFFITGTRLNPVFSMWKWYEDDILDQIFLKCKKRNFILCNYESFE